VLSGIWANDKSVREALNVRNVCIILSTLITNYDTNFTQKIQIIKESNDIVNREQLVFGKGAIAA
jgi:hypothetical protein